MHLNDVRLKEIVLFYNDNGAERTVQKFGISHESLHRYKREYKIRYGEGGTGLKEFTSPKVLVVDIETCPIIASVWGLWKQDIQPDRIIHDWCVLTWSAKWLNDNEIYYGKITPAEVARRDDKRIIKEIWAFIEDADVLIAHNGEKFDFPRLNTRFILNGLNPPLSYQVIDTLKLARRKFSFTSNKLDYIGQILGLGGKIKTEFDLWKRAVAGEQEAIDLMCTYNQRDVTLLEEVYLKIGRWMPSHPNLGVYVDDNHTMCPACTSTDVVWKGYYTTLCGRYSTYRCNHCGFIGRSRHNILTKEKRESLGVSIAR